ncbi:MAG: hypothetical protein EKK42_13915 [Pseudonocardiaceae bacterium]|nr:MAG: hypothetical protein EKK42_13915 [Pseudonocardiaceae bacterium]
MRVTRWVSGAVVTGVAATALVVGGGTAFADAPPTKSGGSQNTCTERIPKLLARIDKVTARINGDASTRGSTAWLTNKESTARAAGDDALADLIAARLSHRQDRLDQLSAAKKTVEDIRTKDCS